MGAAQIILLILSGLAVFISFQKDGERRSPWSFSETLVGQIVLLGLLWWGGFFS